MVFSVSRLSWVLILCFLGLGEVRAQYTWNQTLSGEFRNDSISVNTVLFAATLSGSRFQTASAATTLQVNVVVPTGFTTGSGWTVRTSWTGGAADNSAAVQSVGLTAGVVGSPSAVVVVNSNVQGNRHRFAWRYTDQSGANTHKQMSVASAARPVIVEGSSSATLLVALHNSSGTVVDSATVTVNLSANFNHLTGTTPNISPTHGVGSAPSVHLYYNGVVPPAGRAGTVPEYTDSLAGQVTNNDDEAHDFEIWADVDGDGEPEKIWGIEIPPGQTVPITWGGNLPEGVEPFVVTDGELSGFGTFSGGNESGRAGVFPDQDKEKANIVVLPDVEQLVPVGNADSKQDVLVPPPPQATKPVNYEREYSGGYTVGEGSEGLTVTVIPASAPGEPETKVVGGTGTVIAGIAETVEGVVSAIVTDSQGRNHAVGNKSSGSSGGSRTSGIAGGNSTQGGSVSSGGSSQTGSVGGGGGSTGGASTASDLIDKAAAQIAEVRAEMAAHAASIVGGVLSVDSAESAGAGAAGGEGGPFAGFVEANEGMAGLRESLGIGTVLDTSVIPENPGFGTSKVLTVAVPGLNYTFNLDFDIPVIEWVRSILFAIVCLWWFFFMVKLLKL